MVISMMQGQQLSQHHILLKNYFTLHDGKLSNYVNLLPVKPWYRFLFDNGEYLDYGNKLSDTIKRK